MLRNRSRRVRVFTPKAIFVREYLSVVTYITKIQCLEVRIINGSVAITNKKSVFSGFINDNKHKHARGHKMP